MEIIKKFRNRNLKVAIKKWKKFLREVLQK